MDTWLERVADYPQICMVCDGELPRDDFPGAFVVMIEMEDPKHVQAMASGVCEICAEESDDDDLYDVLERQDPGLRPLAKA